MKFTPINIPRIPLYKIHNSEILDKDKNALAAKIFIFWMQKFYAELIPGWNASIYLGYSYDDPEKREPYYYKDAMNVYTRAISDYYLNDRVVNFTFNLSSDYSDIIDIDDLIFEIGQTAYHEVLHVVLAKMDASKNIDAIHEVIVNLENNTYPYIYNETLSSLKREFNL